MQWLFDIVLEMVAKAGYALKAWVLALGYATETWVLARLCTSSTRVYLTGLQSIPTSTLTRISFNNESWDVKGEFAFEVFTAKKAGYFQVNIAALGEYITEGKRWVITIYKNGAIHSQTVNRAVVTGHTGAEISDILYLNGTTDYIDARAFQDCGVNKNIYGHPVFTFMSIHQLSKDSWL